MSMTIGEIISSPKMIKSRDVLSSEIDSFFHNDPMLSHIMIVDMSERPTGLITRSAYYNRTGGAYGYQLFAKKHADILACRDFFRVSAAESVSQVAKRAMERPSDRLYDPIVVVEEGTGRLGGTVTIKNLLENSERELVTAKELAEEATRHKSAFLATMSHEIRTPLNAVINLTEAVLRGVLSDSQRDRLDAVHSSADHLLQVVNDILDFSKIEAGKLDLECVDFDLVRLLELAVTAIRPLCENKCIDLDLLIAPETPRLLKGDPSRLRQIVINLLGNAVKFTEKGGVCLEVAPAEGDGLGSGFSTTLRFTVKDTGMGIPAEAVPLLFARYTQADKSVSRKFGGTGLGLAICRQLSELMGGRIWVESVTGQGSAFHFTAGFGIGAQPVKPESMAVRIDAGISLMRILAAEDSAMNGKVLEALFECLNVKDYQIVADGAQAIKALTRKCFDIILMDIEMPIMDGFESTQRIRKGEAGEEMRAIPVVALTAHAVGDIKDRCLEAGMNGYLTKPLNLKEVHDTILLFTGKRSTGDDHMKRHATACVIPDTPRVLPDRPVDTFLGVGDRPRRLPTINLASVSADWGMQGGQIVYVT